MRTEDCFFFEDLGAEDVVDTSFTLSFTPELNQGQGGWLCFHDYAPDVYMEHVDGLFLFKDRKVYQTNKGKKGKYCSEVIYDSHIEPVFVYGQNVLTETIDWKLQTRKDERNYNDVTLDSLFVYNDTQCSGITNVVPFGGRGTASAFNVNGVWKLNKFEDRVIDITKPFMRDGEIDYTNIANRIALFGSKYFVSTYLVCRFIFSNIDNYEFSLTDVGVNGALDYR